MWYIHFETDSRDIYRAYILHALISLSFYVQRHVWSSHHHHRRSLNFAHAQLTWLLTWKIMSSFSLSRSLSVKRCCWKQSCVKITSLTHHIINIMAFTIYPYYRIIPNNFFTSDPDPAQRKSHAVPKQASINHVVRPPPCRMNASVIITFHIFTLLLFTSIVIVIVAWT